MKQFLLCAVLALSTTSIYAQQSAPRPAQAQRLPVASLNAGMHIIRAEVAARDQDRQQGLMFREKMGQNEGMLFVFDTPIPICMWMKNTLLPLSVAFLDDQGAIVNVEDMEPQTLDSHCAKQPVRYALEMNQGWFAKRGFNAGSKITGLPGR